MKFRKSILSSVYARMFLVICTAAIPTFIGLCFYVYQQRMDFERMARDNGQSYVDLAAHYQNWLITSSNETLKAMAAVPMIRRADWAVCSAYLEDLVKQQIRYVNFGIISPDGSLLCSAMPVPPGTNLRDRPYFINALKSPDFVIGEYQLGRIAKVPTLAVATALRDEKHQPYGVLFATLNLATMADTLADMNIAAGARFMVLDRHGELLQSSAAPNLPDGGRVDLSRVVQLSRNGNSDRGAAVLRADDDSEWLVLSLIHI